MSLLAIDSHTEGEPTRILVEGIPDLGDGSVTDRALRFDRDHDRLRTALVCEPRGHDVLVGGVLLPSNRPSIDAGVIFVNNVGRLGMCVHGTIGMVRTLQHLGRVGREPGTRVRLETPVGDVSTTVGEAGEIVVENVPAHRAHRRIEIQLDDRTVHVDVAWGGNWFALVSDHGERIEPVRVPRLKAISLEIRDRVNHTLRSRNEAMQVDHVELFGPAGDGADSRNFVLCPGGAYDRSPCGTGTSAKLACLAADGELDEGQPWIQESLIGSRFTGWWTAGADPDQIVPHIAGRAWITGEFRLVMEQDDPYREGLFSGPAAVRSRTATEGSDRDAT